VEFQVEPQHAKGVPSFGKCLRFHAVFTGVSSGRQRLLVQLNADNTALVASVRKAEWPEGTSSVVDAPCAPWPMLTVDDDGRRLADWRKSRILSLGM
jgi:hypothetical protein